MCQECVNKANINSGPDRVVSLADLSALLIDAFQESAGEHTAVIFALNNSDVVPLFGVNYDRDRQCIVINVGYADTGINSAAIAKKIKEVNGH